MDKLEINLIKKARKLISVKASRHWSAQGKQPNNPHGNSKKIYRTIIIETNKGIYAIGGCPNCSGLWWDKVPRGEAYG